jgi:S-adenosylmethionine synthetase
VSSGHPDKVCDQISDAVLDAFLEQDPNARVACETFATTGLVVIGGEISADAWINFQDIGRQVLRDIGYTDEKFGISAEGCSVMFTIDKQSSDIAMGVNEGEGEHEEAGAGDQGLMFGYACNETPELMPLPIMLSHQIINRVEKARHGKELKYLRPDAKSQVTVEYDENDKPTRVDTVVVSTQHDADTAHWMIVRDVTNLVKEVVPEKYIDKETKFHINPTGNFVIGGPHGDTGLTGRKIIVDTYGGMARHGGGAFSGKDPTKVDRSAAYMARHIAKTIVASGVAEKCEVQLAYAIGVADPVSVRVDTMGTSDVDESLIENAVKENFKLTPSGIIEYLDLRKPIYRKTSYGGHFGRNDVSWEKVRDGKKKKFAYLPKSEKKEEVSTEVVNTTDIEIAGLLIDGEIYYIHERTHKSESGYTKYLSQNSTNESSEDSKYLFTVKFLGGYEFKRVKD